MKAKEIKAFLEVYSELLLSCNEKDEEINDLYDRYNKLNREYKSLLKKLDDINLNEELINGVFNSVGDLESGVDMDIIKGIKVNNK